MSLQKVSNISQFGIVVQRGHKACSGLSWRNSGRDRHSKARTRLFWKRSQLASKV